MSKAESFVNSFMTHRNVLPDLLDHLTDKDMSFTPWEGAMTTSGLIWHMLSSSFAFAHATSTGIFERLSDTPALSTVADVKAAIETWTTKTVEAIQSMDDAQFAQNIDMTKVFGREIPAGILLHSMRDHEIHHKGQLYVYARLCGAEKLPFFVNRG